MCSGPKYPFAMCDSRARVNPCAAGMHSVLAMQSLDFELIFHSLSSSIINPDAWCVAFLRGTGVALALWPRGCLTIGSKKMSPAKHFLSR